MFQVERIVFQHLLPNIKRKGQPAQILEYIPHGGDAFGHDMHLVLPPVGFESLFFDSVVTKGKILNRVIFIGPNYRYKLPQAVQKFGLAWLNQFWSQGIPEKPSRGRFL